MGTSVELSGRAPMLFQRGNRGTADISSERGGEKGARSPTMNIYMYSCAYARMSSDGVGEIFRGTIGIWMSWELVDRRY